MSIMEKIRSLINYKTNLYMKDFLLTWEKSLDEIKCIIDVANIIKEMRKNNISTNVYQNGLAVSIFRDKSTRTRFSFASACNLIGLALQDLDEEKSQISHGETVRETANMISFLTEVIGIRDDMYLGAGNAYMREVAQSLDDGVNNGVLPQRPTIVNLQCDIDHPTQTLADLAWLIEYFGGIDKLRGKKIAMSWAYSPSYGKPLSVPQGIIGLMTRLGMDVVLAHPEGYNLIPDVIKLAYDNAKNSGGSFRIVNNMEEAFKDADIVYPKSWAPYTVMERRTQLLKQKDMNGLKELEKECLANNAKYKNWECNQNLMKLTKNGEALYMHCLPADISGVSCESGEVSSNTFEKYRIATYKEAGYKPYIITAMILTSRFKDVGKVLEHLYNNRQKRIIFDAW